MEQYNKIVLEAPSGNIVIQPTEGNEYKVIKGENGELIVQLVPNERENCQNNNCEESTTCSQSNVAQNRTTCSQSEVAQERVASSQSKATEKSEDKAKYFTKISAKEREKVKKWLVTQENAPEWAVKFLKTVRKAVQKVNYDYWIANLEPSVANGKIYYAKGEKVGVGFSCKEWKKMAKKYAIERGSRQSNLYELFIWYALRIADGLWTLEYVAKDSSSAGNYWNAPNSTHNMERTGARECGGYHDGQGNTYKIVTVEDGYALVGGGYYDNGGDYPVADVNYYDNPGNPQNYGCGVLVLTK